MKQTDIDNILAKWFVGEISDNEFKNHVSEEDYFDYLKLRKATELYAFTKQELSPDLLRKIKQKTKPKKTIYKLAVYATSIAAILFLFISINNFFSPTEITVATNYGETKSFYLPDGSKVVLGNLTKITYSENNWKKNREVKLNGQAYFEVKKGKTFTVKTNKVNIKVLGTRFEAKSIEDLLKVVCFEGRVMVKNKHIKKILTPNHSLTIFDNKLYLNKTDFIKPDWINGNYKYKSVPLKYVLKDLENQFGVVIEANSVDVNQLFTGSFNKNNLELALKVVLKPLKIKYNKKSDKIVLDKIE